MNRKNRKTNKYPNGYAPKISYWTNKLSETSNLEERSFILGKIKYFTDREQDIVQRLLMNEYRDGEEILRHMGG